MGSDGNGSGGGGGGSSSVSGSGNKLRIGLCDKDPAWECLLRRTHRHPAGGGDGGGGAAAENDRGGGDGGERFFTAMGSTIFHTPEPAMLGPEGFRLTNYR